MQKQQATIRIDIRSRWDHDKIIYSAGIPANTSSGMQMHAALEKATTYCAYLRGAYLRSAYLRSAYLRGAYLRGADLRSAYLRGAYLRGADLSGADLSGADLGGADLSGADLSGACLRGADLSGADLRSADLSGADLRSADLSGADLRSADLHSADLRSADLRSADGEKIQLIGDRPVMAIGPIGSRADTLFAFITDHGVYVRTGCFFGTVEEFAKAVHDEHADNGHAQEYRVALSFIDTHARYWTPEQVAQEAA